jgi:hypothetical protein
VPPTWGSVTFKDQIGLIRKTSKARALATAAAAASQNPHPIAITTTPSR